MNNEFGESILPDMTPLLEHLKGSPYLSFFILLAVISYLTVRALVPYFTKREEEKTKRHKALYQYKTKVSEHKKSSEQSKASKAKGAPTSAGK
ncbi:hypothetical protein BCT23_17695 [Enterovibrio norvegicus]|uniref:Uncharacterized protein n=1 Tax=Enterovibrio norvegicus TaxID=188144 RepID=A0A2N7L9W0_9GAMM|nr:hypothetical protein BCT23_17695 [Enterovibrio norvegicus]